VLFDDLPAADRSLQVAAYELLLDRRLGDLYRLPDGWLVMDVAPRPALLSPNKLGSYNDGANVAGPVDRPMNWAPAMAIPTFAKPANRPINRAPTTILPTVFVGAPLCWAMDMAHQPAPLSPNKLGSYNDIANGVCRSPACWAMDVAPQPAPLSPNKLGSYNSNAGAEETVRRERYKPTVFVGAQLAGRWMWCINLPGR
jgi:hypothetical protein